MSFITTPLVIFLIFVAPIWLVLHYRAKKQSNQGLSADDQKKMQALIERTETLQKRLVTLEQVLDKEAPNWRKND
ncbi:phage shock protein B [Psychromonas marina]|uniref:Phage shock protein B n=1 Tax=Psychromonas marina TaxID=88364 RepID=A0ABQ6DY11_9GAMM|nr:envelope stress response membrane protein PspB [Psychromonas marina]GLS89965.1 phage shock protein B [Psychromonas marina]